MHLFYIKNIEDLIFKYAASLWVQLKSNYSEEDILYAMKHDPSYDIDKLQNIDKLSEAINTVNGKLGKFTQFILKHIEEIKQSYFNDIDNILKEYLVAKNSQKINFETP